MMQCTSVRYEFQGLPKRCAVNGRPCFLWTMSIDLDWGKLDASFASSFIDAFNGQLQNVLRPSFMGPIEITSFDFGSQPPDVELIDMRDIYRDFLEDDDNDNDEEEGNTDDLDAPAAERGPIVHSAASVPLTQQYPNRDHDQDRDRDRDRDDDDGDDDEDEFEWVSRRSARRGLAVEEAAPMYYHHLPPHIRYARGPASDVLAHPSQPPLPHALGGRSSSSLAFGSVAGESVWNSAGAGEEKGGLPHASESAVSGGGGRPATATAGRSDDEHMRTTTFSPSVAPSWTSFPDTRHTHPSSLGSSTRPPAAPSSSSSPPPSPFSPHRHPADTTVVGPPPPQTAAVPGEPTTASPLAPSADEHPNLQLHLFVSWHSDLRMTLTTSLRIDYPSPLFMSLPIKLSVTGLVFNGELAVAYEGGRRVHLCVLDDLDPYGPSARRSANSQGSTPSDPEGDDAHEAKPLPVGQRLLPEIFIESELGQTDKHVLKNVTRVEKFIQDVIRKTVEEELVFPNFHTLVLK